jgi:ankyrin repeat protein
VENKEIGIMSDQSPSLEEIKEFVIAGHGNLEKVRQMCQDQPALLEMGYEWRPGDTETALQAASHVGNRSIATYLLAQGAPMEICTAAMLGDRDEIDRMLRENPDRIHAKGAHGIPLMTHAVLSGDVEMAEWLFQRGATEGISSALSMVVGRGDVDMVRWLLEDGSPDLTWKNIQGKTAREIAVEKDDIEIIKLLEDYGQSN